MNAQNEYEQQEMDRLLEEPNTIARAIDLVDGYLILLQGQEGAMCADLSGKDDHTIAEIMIRFAEQNRRQNPDFTIEVRTHKNIKHDDALAEVVVEEDK